MADTPEGGGGMGDMRYKIQDTRYLPLFDKWLFEEENTKPTWLSLWESWHGEAVTERDFSAPSNPLRRLRRHLSQRERQGAHCLNEPPNYNLASKERYRAWFMCVDKRTSWCEIGSGPCPPNSNLWVRGCGWLFFGASGGPCLGWFPAARGPVPCIRRRRQCLPGPECPRLPLPWGVDR